MQSLAASDICNAFKGKIEPVRPSLGYMLGLLLSLIAVLMLPLIYIALIGLAAWGMLLYAMQAGTWLGVRSIAPHLFLLKAVLFIAPLVAGGIIILLMLKPLFARPSRRVSPYALERSQEPGLFLLVEQVADAIGAPVPKRIELIAEPNASASFRRGVLSFLGSDLTLQIGMSLVMCMDTRQIAGIIAHELGHFTQRFAMRSRYLIDIVNAWFARVAYQRDAWDDHIDGMLDSGYMPYVIIGLMSQLGVFLCRKILFVFMLLGRAVTCFTMRRMEYNADLSEMRLVGSDVFEATSTRLEEIGVAFSFTLNELSALSASGKLPNDLPALTRSQLLVMPTGLKAALAAVREHTRGRLFDTHPPTRLRIEHARTQAAEGIFHLDVPAERLLANPSVLAQWTTVRLYREGYGLDVGLDDLAPVEDVVQRRTRQHTAREAAHKWLPAIDHPCLLPGPLATEKTEPAKAAALLRKTGDLMAKHREQIDQVVGRHRKHATRRECLAAALMLIELNRKVPSRLVESTDPQPDALRRARATDRQRLERDQKLLDEYALLLGRRLDAIRTLAASGRANGAFKKPELVDARVASRIKMLNALATHRDRLCEMQATMRIVDELQESIGREKQVPQPVLDRATVLAANVRTHLTELRSLEMDLVPGVPDAKQLPEIFDAAHHAIGQSLAIASDAVGELALLSERIEHSVGTASAAT